MTTGFFIHDPSNVLRFIIKYKISNGGNSPSIRDISNGCQISSTSNVSSILKHLEHTGKIKISKNRSRLISIPGERWIPPKDFANV